MNVDLLCGKKTQKYIHINESMNRIGNFVFYVTSLSKLIFFQKFSPTTSSDILKTVEAVNADWDFFKGTEITIILY